VLLASAFQVSICVSRDNKSLRLQGGNRPVHERQLLNVFCPKPLIELERKLIRYEN
jgi:hypothetical protein